MNCVQQNIGAEVQQSSFANNLFRDVYFIAGVPVDAVSMHGVLDRIEAARVTRTPILMSTVNLNFIALAAINSEFKESLLLSDLCTADGISVLLIARLLGIRLARRVAGADIFDALKTAPQFATPLKAVFFGGNEGVAAQASRLLNAEEGSLRCVKTINPGFGSVADFSRDELISEINQSGADILIAALGAKSGQLWLLRNHEQLKIPIRAHLGATLNFQAGTVKRAPVVLQHMGLEWLWRVKEEPRLANRYARDIVLLGLLLARVLILIFYTKWLKLISSFKARGFSVISTESDTSVTIAFEGVLSKEHATDAARHFHAALLTAKQIVVDLSRASMADNRFLGTLIMLRKCVIEQGSSLRLTGVSPQMRRLLKLSGAAFLSF